MALQYLVGGGSGNVVPKHPISILDALNTRFIDEKNIEITYASGVDIDNAIKVAKEADYVIINNIYWNGYKSKKIEYLRENYTKFFEIKKFLPLLHS